MYTHQNLSIKFYARRHTHARSLTHSLCLSQTNTYINTPCSHTAIQLIIFWQKEITNTYDTLSPYQFNMHAHNTHTVYSVSLYHAHMNYRNMKAVLVFGKVFRFSGIKLALQITSFWLFYIEIDCYCCYLLDISTLKSENQMKQNKTKRRRVSERVE